MRIQHNIMAMSAYRNYTNNVSAMKKNLEKLSSGYKINRAGDDAAGLAISEKMRAQITGLETAQKNAKDGISLVQTAEGALTEVHDMLNRMVELATQSANGTYDNDTDRLQLQKEVNQLRSEIDRIADSANFNGIKLLDGSMDADGGVAGTMSNYEIAPEGDDMQVNTILNKKSNENDASFTLELHGAKVDGLVEGETLKVELGSETYEVTIDNANSSKSLAELVAAAVTAKGTYEGKAITATADTTGNKVNFTVDKANAFNADLHVKLGVTANPEGYTATATAGTATEKLIGSAAAGTAAITVDNTTDFVAPTAVDFKLDEINKVLTAAGGVTSDTNFTIAKNDDGKFELKVGDIVVGTADAFTAAPTAAAGQTLTFKNGTTTVATIEVKAKAGQTPDVDAANDLEFTVTGASVKAYKAKVGTAAAASFTGALASASGIKKLAEGGALTVRANSDGSGLEVYVGDSKVSDVTVSITAANKLKLTVGGKSFSVTVSGVTATTATSAVAALLGEDGVIETGVNVEAGERGEIQGTFNEFTTENKSNTSTANNKIASTTFEIKADQIKNGAFIQIGNAKYSIKEGTENKIDGDSAEGGTIYLTKELLAGEDKEALVDTAGELLSRFTANKDFTIGYKSGNNKVSVHEKTEGTGADTKAVEHDFSKIEGGNVETMEGFSKLLGFGTDLAKGKGLTLQIGDTADDYNKLTVNIKDMHVANLGLGGIDIQTQEGAADAVKKIKEAINKVSDVRGTLGATQNRLDHTINNLSVMTENIQDAESTIRDVDVAEEMMAYTKNNILIQSAQAMLAQANQVPQGVLQLLQ